MSAHGPARSANSMIDARSCSMCRAPSRVQVMPLPFIRAATTFLQALSTVPLPIGKCAWRYCWYFIRGRFVVR